MTEKEKQLMDQFDITYETLTIFNFRGYRYERLNDALAYAKNELAVNLKLQDSKSKK